jgi:hypothetical protein
MKFAVTRATEKPLHIEVAIIIDLDDIDLENGISAAERETGYTLPQTTNFRIELLIKRATRHTLYTLVLGAARKFRAEGFHLDQRFKHYSQLVKDMDEEYKQLIEDHPEEFTLTSVSDEAIKLFGSLIDAGFSSDHLGRDTTYTDDNEVIVTPNESS